MGFLFGPGFDPPQLHKDSKSLSFEQQEDLIKFVILLLWSQTVADFLKLLLFFFLLLKTQTVALKSTPFPR